MDEEHQYRNLLLGRLRQETQHKITELSKNEKNKNYRPVFVLEWIETIDRQIIGLGCDEMGAFKLLNLNIRPGLYAVVSDFYVLHAHLVTLSYETNIEIYDKFQFKCNNFSVVELLQNYVNVESSTCVLVKIITPTVRDATDLYFRFLKNDQAYKFINVPMYWTINWQVMFDRLIKHHEHKQTISSYTMPKVIYRWFDENLESYKTDEPQLPIITFDIETVSNDPNRVPTGEDQHDILFTVSVYYRHTHTVYTLIALPIPTNALGNSTQESIQRIQQDNYENDYKYFNNPTQVFECFATEKELLIRTMELLRPDGVHYLLGYNSMGYDIKYLLMRCAFFNLPLDEFMYRDGYSTCARQIHIDIFRAVRSKFDKSFKSYKLGIICGKLFNLTKQDVDAVKIRYTYSLMKKMKRYVSTEECLARGFPPISHICHYNNYDTLLTDKLEMCIDGIKYMIEQAHSGRLSVSSLNVHLKQIKCRLWSSLTIRGLEQQIFLTTFKPSTFAVKAPIYNDSSVPIDYIGKIYNFDHLLSLEKVGAISQPQCADAKKKYPGGANFCLGLFDVEHTQVYDYKTAYPLLIDRENISDETSAIITASVLLNLMGQLTEMQRSTFTLYDYYVHTGRNKSETAILYYKYLKLGMRCGGQFAFTQEELYKRGNAPIVIIWKGRGGVLSEIIKHINIDRENTKRLRDLLKSIIGCIDDRIQKIKERQTKLLFSSIEANQIQCDKTDANNDDDADDDGDFGAETESNGDFGAEAEDFDAGDFGVEDDDDDGDFGQEDCNDEEFTELTSFSASDPYKFNLPSNIISINVSGGCEFNDVYLNTLSLDELLNTMMHLRELVNILQVQHSSLYASQKTFIASIYGCIGSTSQNCAAIITNIIRSTLIEAAQYMGQCGYTVYFMDTDSIFAKHPTSTKNMSSELNAKFPHTEIEMKVYPRCMFVQKKSYLRVDDEGDIHYFQNNNGPTEWRKFVQFMFKQQWVKTNQDIERAFELFFQQYYDKLMSFTEICFEFKQLFMRTVTFHRIPKTNTPIKRFREFLQINYPTMVGTSKQEVYYIFGNGLDVELRPEVHFTNIQEQLKTINVFKYFDNMFKTVYNVLLFTIIRNNQPNNIMLNENLVRYAMINGFYKVYNQLFPAISSMKIIQHTCNFIDLDECNDVNNDDDDDDDDDADYECDTCI